MRTGKQTNKRRHRSLTVADFLARHVVAGREAVLGHRHVRVEGEGQQARGRLDLRRDLGPAVAADQRSHCRGINQTDLITARLFFFCFFFTVSAANRSIFKWFSG